ncbi:glycoside hydrolase family 13 protein [Aquabacterium humicola]|uniref:glycoside hydrolase family 13 protein n=1 Tax=Aquabacterium humicola TaxID=3237377 RepID=UPI0025430CDE|nr:glycoside hydrolase family 13 protein [Rubrivivax pictus]
MRHVLTLLLLLCCFAARAAAPVVERIDPPFWWTGMKNPRLQLMLYGPRIGDATATVRAPGLRVSGQRRGDSPNVLFVDLQIGAGAKPGRFDLVLARAGESTRRAYELHERIAGSAQRQGFGPRDVILNLVPDRFANGDPANDNIAGYPDPANRADISGGRHGGDIAGIVQHLDYIAGLGYTMLWPTPLLENKQPSYSYHGYAITDGYRVDPRFGSNDDYKRLVEAARARGIGTIQDIVLNHIGSGHHWMADLPTKDWLTMDGRFVPTRHARTAVSDPYAAPSDRENFMRGWFTENMPDLNQRQPLLATWLIQNTIWWIEYAGLAGVRADTWGYSDRDFLAQWTKAVLAEYPKLNIVGEEWSGNPVVVSYWQRGKKNPDGYVSHLPALMDFPLHYVLRRALASGESWNGGFNELYEGLINDKLYPDPSNMVLFEGNHDVPRLFSVLDEDVQLTKMALAYVLTMRGIPQLYYGTEVLMTSPKQRDDGATRQDFPGGWADDRVNARTGAGLTDAQRDVQAFVRKLMNWRKTAAVIHTGRLVHYAPENGTYAFFRHDGAKRVMVVFNKNSTDTTLQTARFAEMLTGKGSGSDVISGRRIDFAQPTFTLPARSVMVLELQ